MPGNSRKTSQVPDCSGSPSLVLQVPQCSITADAKKFSYLISFVIVIHYESFVVAQAQRTDSFLLRILFPIAIVSISLLSMTFRSAFFAVRVVVTQWVSTALSTWFEGSMTKLRNGFGFMAGCTSLVHTWLSYHVIGILSNRGGVYHPR